MAEKYENEEHRLQIKQTMNDLFKPFQEMLDKKRWDTAKLEVPGIRRDDCTLLLNINISIKT